ncbi:hypothetical protein NQ318_008186 [Aromia moschata]|uniref:PIN domain-containing protein n=1 Tax=Aromia moschata TaxID=1265417 RepID=A0AAV8YKS4_9CUCU|nr:hypothetical protein NQ318_008186 [Aromia moschata]
MSTKSDNKIENDKSEIKSPSIPLDANTSHRENADLPASWENHGSFSDKMAMTASWIIHHHQDVNNVMNSSAETSANSLQVNVDTSASRINFANETEDMEWTNAEPDDQVVNLSTQEATVSTEQHRIDHEEAENKRDHKESQQKLKDICVVVDTNVFISGLSKIQDIMNMKVTERCTESAPLR